jgi:hypothetical protein
MRTDGSRYFTIQNLRSCTMSYALYKFHKAILSLDGTELQPRQWLASSYMHHIVNLRDHDLPEPVRRDFEELRGTLTRVAADGPAETLEQTVKSMDNAEVNSVIDRIIAIYDSIRQHERATEQA